MTYPQEHFSGNQKHSCEVSAVLKAPERVARHSRPEGVILSPANVNLNELDRLGGPARWVHLRCSCGDVCAKMRDSERLLVKMVYTTENVRAGTVTLLVHNALSNINKMQLLDKRGQFL